MVEENVGGEDPHFEAIGNIDSCGMFFSVGVFWDFGRHSTRFVTAPAT